MKKFSYLYLIILVVLFFVVGLLGSKAYIQHKEAQQIEQKLNLLLEDLEQIENDLKQWEIELEKHKKK